MKKIVYSILALCSLTAFGQEKTFSFDKKITYKVNLPEEYKELVSIQNDNFQFVMYLSKEAVLGTAENTQNFLNYYSTGNTFFRESFLITDHKYFDVTANTLENNLSIKLPSYYEGIDEEEIKPYQDHYFSNITNVVNLNKTSTINGYTCNNYEVISKKDDFETTTSICVDEKNSIDNISFLLSKQNIKGLLVNLTTNDEATFGFTVDKIGKANAKLTFDQAKEIEKFAEKLEKSKTYYEDLYANTVVDSTYTAYNTDNRYEDPIINFYTYQTSENDNVNQLFSTIAGLNYNLVYTDADYDGNPDLERSTALTTAEGSTNQLIKQFKKNKLANKGEVKELNNLFKTYFEDAKNFKLTEVSTAYDDAPDVVDSAYEAVDIADYYDPYTSTYKTTDISVIDLAIDNPNVQSYLKIAPAHCKDLKTKIPAFTDKELGNLVYNYAGQICDLYIYQSGSVGLTETIDAMRKSVLEITNKFDKLKKEDKDKLTTFFNSLD